jgi:hypothetical protein
VGVRTFSTGEVRSGRWLAGQLESPLELWQCVNAAEGAAEAALAARRVEVGGGTFSDAGQLLLQHVPLWALVAAVGLNVTQVGARGQGRRGVRPQATCAHANTAELFSGWQAHCRVNAKTG